jgi:hypothetical protein
MAGTLRSTRGKHPRLHFRSGAEHQVTQRQRVDRGVIMVVVMTQHRFGRRVIALALLGLIPLVFVVLALLVGPAAQDDEAPVLGPQRAATLPGQAPAKPEQAIATTGAAATVRDDDRTGGSFQGAKRQ